MLRNIDPILSPSLLGALRAMGHGDDICLVDANFPAESVTGSRPLIRLDGVSMNQVANAVFSVLPLDSFVEQPMVRMEMVGQPQQMPEVQVEVLALARLHYDAGLTMGSLERFAFYEVARQAFVIVSTGDRRRTIEGEKQLHLEVADIAGQLTHPQKRRLPALHREPH